MLLCSQGECVVIGIHAVHAESVQAIKDAGRAREFAPLKVAWEPPRQLIARRQLRIAPNSRILKPAAAPGRW